MQPPNRKATGPVPLLLKSYRWPVRGGDHKHRMEEDSIYMQALMETAGASARSWSPEGDGSGRAVSGMLGVGAANRAS